MSCHNIGRAMSHLIGGILREYDDGHIDFETAKRLAIDARESIGYCDGNSNEAVEVFEDQRRCSCCFRVLSAEQLLGIEGRRYPEDIGCSEAQTQAFYTNMYGDKVIGYVICEECLQKLQEHQ